MVDIAFDSLFTDVHNVVVPILCLFGRKVGGGG